MIGLIAGGIVFSLIMVVMLVLKPNSNPTTANVPNDQAKVLGTIGSANAQETIANGQDNPDDGKANDAQNAGSDTNVGTEPNTGSESNADVEPTPNTGLETDDAKDANVNVLPIEPEPTPPAPVETDNPDDDDDDESANGDDKGQAQAHKEPTKPAAKKPAAKKPNKTSKPSKKADKSDKSKSAVPKKVNGNGSTPKDFDSDLLPF